MVCLLALTATRLAADDLMFYDVSKRLYASPGDVNIGVIMTNTHGLNGNKCHTTQLPGSWGIEYPEAVAFVVDAVNRNGSLLPNVSLGFYILDDCELTSIALAQSLSFIARPVSFADGCPAAESNYTFSEFYGPGQNIPAFDVIGIVAPMTSTATVSISYLYTAANMPIVGYITSSEELSNKDLHPLFFRVIGPDKFQADAMIQFVYDRGWSYVSVVYSLGPYGERGFDSLKASAARYNICIAASHRVSETDDTDPVAANLVLHAAARVVILFAEEFPTKHVLQSVVKLNATGQFIWISSDSIFIASKESLSEHRDVFVGAFIFFFYSPLVREFYEFVRKQNVSATRNPWFRTAWEYLTNCSFLVGDCAESFEILRAPKFEFMPTTTLLMDAVMTYAYAVRDLMRDLCPTAARHEARECVSRARLIQYIKSVSFTGYSGSVKFDSNGDGGGRYVIYQLTYGDLAISLGYGDPNVTLGKGLVMKEVANYDRSTGVVTYTSNNISWDHLVHRDRVVPLSPGETDSGVPESVCSRPCVVGEYKIQKELACCWECRRCRDNERIVDEGHTSCEECPQFTWPDPITGFTSCKDIDLTYQSPSSSLAVLQLTLATIAAVLTIFIAVSYYRLREFPVIKAASRELSLIQLAAVLTGYVNVICFQTVPSAVTCAANFFLFCISFSALYSPLLIKTVRIYRIFRNSAKNVKGLAFISPQSQILISLVLITVQVCLCIAVYIISSASPGAKRTQQVKTEPFVELTCDMTLPGLTSFLVYNLIQVTLCSVFAFKTRKLPDNFNESRFISMCVSTTLVIWLAFIPTYFTAGREYVRVLLLSVALVLNHTVAVVFLFLPKLYAALYVPGGSAAASAMRFTTTSQVHPINDANRVGGSSNNDISES
ncbi:hypothetical protein Btru_023422 [Bulinus truncatus]|nr:hypothetical protein Btru_023422 [Bulinus truncatus]